MPNGSPMLQIGHRSMPFRKMMPAQVGGLLCYRNARERIRFIRPLTCDMDERLLPNAVLAKATLRGNEYAWAFADVEEAIVAAQSLGLATLGGQAQFRLPNGTYEMYWLDADASDFQPGEPWPTFVNRSAAEVLALFKENVTNANFLAEARQSPILCEQIDKGTNVLDYLCFVLDFQAEPAKS
jgi:hypothetical protein